MLSKKEISMKQEFRLRKMLEYLTDHEMLSVNDATVLLSASPATVRRDFSVLARNGSVKKLHGGIIPAQERDSLLPFCLRARWYSEEKRKLAEKTVALLHPGETLFIDGGTTTSHLGMFLPETGYTVITNSLPLCEILTQRFPNKGSSGVLLTGGRLHMASGLLLGSSAEESLRQYHAETTIFSVRGLDARTIYNDTETIAGIEKTMIARSDRLIVIADHSKIGKRAMAQICSIRKAAYLVTTETPENRDILEQIRDTGVQVIA